MESHPSPAFSMYSSSKSFVTYFATAMNEELKLSKVFADKVDTCLYSPGFTSTKLNGLSEAPLVVISPLAAARSSIKDFGRYKYTNATLTHALMCGG